jgi:hypothetical protein
VESYSAAAPRDGFVVQSSNGTASIRGRIAGIEYGLGFDREVSTYTFTDGAARITLSENHVPLSANLLNGTDNHRVHMGNYHILRHLLHGVLDPSVPNQVNIAART